MMSWLQSAKDWFKDYVVAEPIQCPRGWGTVTFQPSVSVLFPVSFGVGLVCPVGGVENCKSCRASFNPDDVEGLRERLSKLEDLRKERTVTGAEYELRRRRIIDLREESERSREEHFRVVGWTLGPAGLVLGISGGLLTWAYHPGLVAIAIAGGLLLAIGLGFLYLSIPRERSSR